MRLAGGIAKRKIGEQKPRHRGMLDDVFGAAHHDRGNAVGLQMPGDQADGLMAYRAVRYQHRGVDLVGLAARENFRRVGFDGDAVAAVGRCAEKARGDFADPSLAL